MYYSEYLRNKSRAAAQIVSPTRVRDAGLWTQIRRNMVSADPLVLPRNGGQVILLSADGVLAGKAGAAVCCGPTLRDQRTFEQEGTCCDLVHPALTPTNFYSAAKPDCCPVNNPSIAPDDKPCCPSLPPDSQLITYRKKPTTEG